MAGLYASIALHDVRLQARYGIYAAYAFVVLVYVIILISAGPYLPDWLAGVIIFSDPAAIGFYFLGALMMLERGEGVRAALAVTPVTAGAYFFGKAFTLTVVAMAAVVVISIAGQRSVDWPLLTAAVVLTSVQYVGIGVPIALRFRTTTAYLIGSAGFLFPVLAPGFLALIDPTPWWLWWIPAVAQLKLMLVATGAAEVGGGEMATLLAVSLVAAAGGTWLALRALGREFGRK